MNKIKTLAIITIIILVGSLTTVALGLMTWRFFWVIAIIAAAIAYFVIPSMKKKTDSQEL